MAEIGNAGVTMKEWVRMTVQILVDEPEKVTVNEFAGEYSVTLEVSVGKGDMGKLVGKNGKHANNIRGLMQAASGKDKKRYILSIID